MIPQESSREEWLEALPQALVAGFVKIGLELQRKGKHRGVCCYVYSLNSKKILSTTLSDIHKNPKQLYLKFQNCTLLDTHFQNYLFC